MENERVTKLEIYMEEVKKDIESLKKDFQEGFSRIERKLDENFVTKTEFWPVKTLVFSLVGLMLVALVGALIKLVIE